MNNKKNYCKDCKYNSDFNFSFCEKYENDLLFVMEGKAFFHAKDINDAFLKLANHFANLHYNPDDERLDIMILGTNLEIKPYDYTPKN